MSWVNFIPVFKWKTCICTQAEKCSANMSYLVLTLLLSINFSIPVNSKYKKEVSKANSMSSMLEEVRSHFHSKCTIFIHVENEEAQQRLISDLMKKQKTPAHAMSMRALLHNKEESRCHHTLPLYVILSPDLETKSLLSKESTLRIFSKSRWLLFLKNDTVLTDFFSDIYIPLDCEFFAAEDSAEAIVWEVYRFHVKSPLQVHPIGQRDMDRKMTWSQESYLKRRGNLQGIPIRAAVDETIPPGKICQDELPLEFCGIVYKVWKALEEYMNFTTMFYNNTSGNRSYQYKNGTWTGTMGMAASRQVDVCIGQYGMTSERKASVDFIAQTFEGRVGVYIRKTQPQNSGWEYFWAPFSKEFWLAVMITILTVYLVFSTVWYLSNQLLGNSLSDEHGLCNSWLEILGIFCLQDSGTYYKTPWSLSSRILYITAYLTSLILYTAYSAIFISFLAVQRFQFPFTGFQGLLDVGNYKLGVLGNSVYLNFFDKATNSLLEQVYKSLILPNLNDLPTDEIQGFQGVCSEENYAFVYDDIGTKIYSQNLSCSVVAVPQAFFVVPGSFIISKNNPYKRIFVHYVQEIRRAGILKRLNDNLFISKTEESEDRVTSVSLQDVFPVFILLSAGILLSIIFLCLEILLECFATKSNKTTKLTLR